MQLHLNHMQITCTLLKTDNQTDTSSLNFYRPEQSPSCDCGQRHTMNHTVNVCQLTKFVGGLNLLLEADDDAVIWLESTATAALAK